MVVGSIVNSAATGAGFMVASIAVGGFIAHAGPALARQSDQEVKHATVVGGLGGLAIAAFLIVGSGLAW